MKEWWSSLLEYNWKEDFINFCKSNWYNKKDVKEILKLLEIFIIDSLLNKWKVMFTWLFTIYKVKTTTTLREWIFNKVKIKLNKNITYLFKRKW